jgi:hypothetical protein
MTALVAVFGIGTLQAAELTITEMSITGGTFALGEGSPTDPISAGDEAPIVMGTYQGVPSDTAAGSLATFPFQAFGPVGTHTADNLDGGQVSVNGGPDETPPAPTGTVDDVAGTISVDLGSWFAFWNGNSFNQGDHAVTGTYDPVTGDYDISWQSLITGGPFDGNIGFWNLTGVVTAGAGPASPLQASVLPSSRSVEVAVTATAFATIINSGTADATGCGIAPSAATPVDAAFLYQTTDAGNNLTGSANTPVDIAAGAQQNYLIAFTPASAFVPTNVELEFDCTDTDPAAAVSGLNTLLLSASDTPIADIVALAATVNDDGYTDIPGDTGTGVFAVAAVNVGSTDTITASSVLSNAALPVTVTLCETDATGACVADPTPTVTVDIASGATPSFAAFVTGTANVTDDPAANRITVQFEDSAQVVRGATSVAVRTVGAVPL